MHKILSILFSISFVLVATCSMAQNPDPTIYMRYGEGRSNTLIVTNGNAFARSSITGDVFRVAMEIDELRTITTNTFAILIPITNDLYALRFIINVVTNQIDNITNRIEEVDYYHTLVYSEEGGIPHYYMRGQPTDLLQPLIEEMPYLKTNNLYDTTVPMPSISWSDTSGDLNLKNAPLNIKADDTSTRTYIDFTGLYFYDDLEQQMMGGLYFSMDTETPGIRLVARFVEAERLHIYGWLDTVAPLGDYGTYGFLMYSPYLDSYYDQTRGDYVYISSGHYDGIDKEYFRVAALGDVRKSIDAFRTELPAEFIPNYYYNDETSESYNLFLGYNGFEIMSPVINTGAYSTHLVSNTVYFDDIPPYSMASVVLARENDSPAYNIFIEKNLDGTFDIVEDTNSWEP